MSEVTNIDFNIESNTCYITKPYEALISKFSRNIIHHLSNENSIEDIVNKIEDPYCYLTENEWNDFLKFIDQHEEFLNKIIKKNNWKLPAWVQSPILNDNNDNMNMQREDHVLYKDGKYQWLKKIKEYIKVRIEFSKESATEEMRSNMNDRNNNMIDISYRNTVSKEDMEKLYKLPLSIREEWGEKIVNREWFWEFWSTVNSGMVYKDMDKDKKREIDNVSDSKRFLEFKNKVKGMEMMSLSQHIELMNMVWKQLDIEDKIDLNYINTVFKKYPNENLPKDNNLWRILRWLSVILGQWFVIPISVYWKRVYSVDCIFNYCGIFNRYYRGSHVRPLFKINMLYSNKINT